MINCTPVDSVSANDKVGQNDNADDEETKPLQIIDRAVYNSLSTPIDPNSSNQEMMNERKLIQNEDETEKHKETEKRQKVEQLVKSLGQGQDIPRVLEQMSRKCKQEMKIVDKRGDNNRYKWIKSLYGEEIANQMFKEEDKGWIKARSPIKAKPVSQEFQVEINNRWQVLVNNEVQKSEQGGTRTNEQAKGVSKQNSEKGKGKATMKTSSTADRAVSQTDSQDSKTEKKDVPLPQRERKKLGRKRKIELPPCEYFSLPIDKDWTENPFLGKTKPQVENTMNSPAQSDEVEVVRSSGRKSAERDAQTVSDARRRRRQSGSNTGSH